jgi:hypothetical protein
VVRGVDDNKAGDSKDLQQEEVAEEAWGHHRFHSTICMTQWEMVNGITKQKKNKM